MRHIARLRRLGGRPKFLGGSTVTGKCTQLTIAITGDVTILKIDARNNTASGTSRKCFGLCPHL